MTRLVKLLLASTILVMWGSAPSFGNANEGARETKQGGVNRAVLSVSGVPEGRSTCARLASLSYRYVNGGHPRLIDTSGANIIDHPDRLELLDDRVTRSGSYVPQSSPNTCYAAVLAMIWLAEGKSTSEAEVASAAQDPCGQPKDGAASFTQVIDGGVFLATKKHYAYLENFAKFQDVVDSGQIKSFKFTQDEFKNTGFIKANFDLVAIATGGKAWVAPWNPKNGLAGLEAMQTQLGVSPVILTGDGLYSGAGWHLDADPSVTGGMFPIVNMADMVARFSQGYYLMAGIKNGNSSHTVLITGLRYLPSGSRATVGSQINYTLDRNTEIVGIRILDPAAPEAPQRWVVSTNAFLSGARFIIAIKV